MKVRNGFVSNSSSSSFILPVSVDKDEIIVKITLQDLLDMMNESCGRIKTISTENELKEYFVDQYAGRDQSFEDVMNVEPWLKKRYEEALFMMDTTGSIITGHVDNNEYQLMGLIQKAGGTVED